MTIEDRLLFGKYKGLRLVDVFKGTLNIDRYLLVAYVEFLLNTDIRFHFESNFGSKVFEFVDKFEVSEQEIKALIFFERGVNEKGVPYGDFEEMGNNLENDLELCLSIGNQRTGFEIGGFCSLSKFSRGYDPKPILGADPRYLCWCIEKIEGFYIPIIEIDQLEKLKISIFDGIYVLRKEGGVYEYFPNMKTGNFLFPERIKKINQLKIDQNGLRNFDKDNYTLDDGPKAYGYSNWDEMSFIEGYEGDAEAWAHDLQ